MSKDFLLAKWAKNIRDIKVEFSSFREKMPIYFVRNWRVTPDKQPLRQEIGIILTNKHILVIYHFNENRQANSFPLDIQLLRLSQSSQYVILRTSLLRDLYFFYIIHIGTHKYHHDMDVGPSSYSEIKLRSLVFLNFTLCHNLLYRIKLIPFQINRQPPKLYQRDRLNFYVYVFTLGTKKYEKRLTLFIHNLSFFFIIPDRHRGKCGKYGNRWESEPTTSVVSPVLL